MKRMIHVLGWLVFLMTCANCAQLGAQETTTVTADVSITGAAAKNA